MNADYDIVIDGSNLINHSEKGVTKLIPSRLIKAIRKVELLGYTPLTCIDRSTYSQAKKQRKPLEGSIEDFAKLIDEEGMRFMNRDDEMIDHALQRGALILTNDRFRKWKDGTEKTKLEIDWDLVDEKLVQWWFEDEFFMPELLKKSSQSSKITGKAPINSVRRLANNNSNKNVQRKKRSMFIKVLDLIFDNNKKAQKKAKVQQKHQPKSKSQASTKPQPKPQQNKAKKNPRTQKPKQAKPPQKKAKPQTNPQTQNPKQAKSEQKQSKPRQKIENALPIEDFRRIILEHLESDPILIERLAGKIGKYMEKQKHEKCNTTEFLKLFGIPKGFKKAIQKYLGDLVVITGSGTKYSIAKAKQTPKPEDLNSKPSQNQNQAKPKITKIKAKKGIKKEPSNHNIVAFRSKILDLLISEESPVNLKNLNLNIINYMKSLDYESSHVTEFLKLFGLPRGIKKAIENHMKEEITIAGESPNWMLKKNPEVAQNNP